MKKSLILFSVAALALVSCAKVTDQYVGAPESHEIAFQALTTPATRAAVDGTTFPDQAMQVAAYQVSPTATNYFTGTTFSKDGTTWKGGKYWPLSPAYINFLAYTGVTGTAAFDGTTPASSAIITQTDNSTTQTDLMYAIGNGQVSQNADNTLTFPTNVPMAFKHAQAWITFSVKANSDTETAITVNSITLNGAKYAGTYTITHTNYNATSAQDVAGAWSSLPAVGSNVVVPGWSATALTTSLAPVGVGLMIVPDDDNTTADFTSFTINYAFDGKTYDYTYTPTTAAAANVDQAKHYIYNITFQLHEILIAPTVTDWADQTATAITI